MKMSELRQKIKKMALTSKLSIIVGILGLCISIASFVASCNANKIAEKANDLSDTANRHSLEANQLSDTANLLSNTANQLSDMANKNSLEANQIAKDSNKIAKEVAEIQNTPCLSAQTEQWSYVGPLEGRIDDVVIIPVIVFNNSSAYANDILLDILFCDGTDRTVSLNDALKKDNLPIARREGLAPSERWSYRAKVSTFPNANESYATGTRVFIAKLQLTWKDAKGNEYKSLNLMKLKYFFIKDKNSFEGFWFESKKTYCNLYDKKGLEENWGLNFDY